MTHWVRLWEDMPTDPKWRVVAKRSGRPLPEVLSVFIAMMTNAGRAQAGGRLDAWDDEDVAAALDMEPEHVTAIRAAMQGKTLDGDQLTGWDKRQPKREDPSSERVRAFRERKKSAETPRNAGETRCNAPEADTDTDTELAADAAIAPARGAKSNFEVECRKLVGEEPVLLALDFHSLAGVVEDGTVTQADVFAGIRAAMAKPGFRIRHWSQLEGWARGAAKERLAGKAKGHPPPGASPASKPLVWVAQGSDAYEAWRAQRPKLVKALLTERGNERGCFLPTEFPAAEQGVAA